ncbi:MAG: hypothetical protein KAW12_03580 [Candidatus Aminicenantes bacterium]|nr:hypothetical protein [Candidatus Aminicenantes bacterium]
MKNILTVVFLISCLLAFSFTLEAKREVGWVVGKHKGWVVKRFKNGLPAKVDAKLHMKLYPGDKLYRTTAVDRILVDFLPYAEVERLSKNTLVIVFNPPENKENIFTKIGKFFGLVQVDFYDTSAASKGLSEEFYLPGENATVIPGQKICFHSRDKSKEVVVKEWRGKEIFRKKITGKSICLLPKTVGIVQDKVYTWAVVNGAEVFYRSMIKLLDRETGRVIGKDLERIESEAISDERKKIKKAAYLQLMSDMYPGQVNLYWLSYRFLKDINSDNEEVKETAETLMKRCVEYFKQGITELDFGMLNSPGCIVTIELERDGEKKYVSPNFSFYEDDGFSIHFQTNFKGYAVILYEDKEENILVFPSKNNGCDVGAKTNNHTIQYEFYGAPCKERYIFILSKNPIKEMKQLQQLLVRQKPGKSSNIEQKKLLRRLIRRVYKEGRELDVKFFGTKAVTSLPGKELSGITWFKIALRNLGKR